MRLMKARKGATLVEYGIMIGLLAVVTIGAVLYTGQQVNVSFEATDASIASAGETPDVVGEIAISPTITATVPSGGDYDFTMTVSGVNSYVPGSITWSVSSGALPAGISLTSINGRLQGTSISAPSGVYTFTIQATDGVATDTQEFTITVL